METVHKIGLQDQLHCDNATDHETLCKTLSQSAYEHVSLSILPDPSTAHATLFEWSKV